MEMRSQNLDTHILLIKRNKTPVLPVPPAPSFPLSERQEYTQVFSSEVFLPVHPLPQGTAGWGWICCTPSPDSPGLGSVCGCGEEGLALSKTSTGFCGMLVRPGMSPGVSNIHLWGHQRAKGARGGHLPTSLVPRSVDADFRACLLLRFPCFIPVCPLKEKNGTVSPHCGFSAHRGAREGPPGLAVPGVPCSWAGCGAVAGDTGTGCTAEVGPAASTSHHLHEEKEFGGIPGEIPALG